MPVDLVVGHLSYESRFLGSVTQLTFRENLVAWFVAGEFVEPIATAECLFPYFRTTEFLEVLYPLFTISFLDKWTISWYSSDVWSRQGDEPNVHSSIVNLFHSSMSSLESGVLLVAFLATFSIGGLPSDPPPEELRSKAGFFSGVVVLPECSPGLRTVCAGETCLILF